MKSSNISWPEKHIESSSSGVLSLNMCANYFENIKRNTVTEAGISWAFWGNVTALITLAVSLGTEYHQDQNKSLCYCSKNSYVLYVYVWLIITEIHIAGVWMLLDHRQ